MICIKGLKPETLIDIDLSEYGFVKDQETGTYTMSKGKEHEILKAGDYVTFEASWRYTIDDINSYVVINGVRYEGEQEKVTFTGFLKEPIKCFTWRKDLVIIKCAKHDMFEDDAIADMHLFFSFSPTGETLEAATAEFKLLFDSKDEVFEPTVGTDFQIWCNGEIIGTFYVNNVLQETSTCISVSAYDCVGFLETIPFDGYIAYKKGTSSTAVSVTSTLGKLCDKLFTFTSAIFETDELKEQPVYGYIPSGNCKDALQFLSIGCGITVRTFRTEVPVIQSSDSYAVYDINDDDVFSDSTVSKNEEKKNAVKIRQTDYIGNKDGIIFSGDLSLYADESIYTLTIGDVGSAVINPDVETVAFSLCAPGLDKTGDEPGLWTSVKGVTILNNTGVTAVVNAGSTDDAYSGHVDDYGVTWRNVILRGIKVIDIYEYTEADPWYITYGDESGECLELSDDATSVTWDNADDVAVRFLRYYGAERIADVTYVMAGSELPGDVLKIRFEEMYGEFIGRITSIDIDVGGDKMIADASLVEFKEET